VQFRMSQMDVDPLLVRVRSLHRAFLGQQFVDMIVTLLVVISVDSAATYLRQEALLSREGTFFGLGAGWIGLA